MTLIFSSAYKNEIIDLQGMSIYKHSLAFPSNACPILQSTTFVSRQPI